MHLRIARPVSDLARAAELYARGLGLREVGRFVDHDGFDGVMLAHDGAGHHFEFTACRSHPVRPSPTPEDLVVFYLPQRAQWQQQCERMVEAGFRTVSSFNPYWDRHGRTFEDFDAYRVVLAHLRWP